MRESIYRFHVRERSCDGQPNATMLNLSPDKTNEVKEPEKPVSRATIAFGAAILLALVGLYWSLWKTGALPILADEQTLRAWIDSLGFWGPLAIIVLMVSAIVMSPIPSGPIAMVAGAAYGPLWGTVYVVIGAEAGALIAFGLARCLGYAAVRRWARVRLLLRRLSQRRSQAWLMAIVFASRLAPFISFDAISYAAGLTPLTFWRFALATLAGVIPIAFVLAYFGDELLAADSAGAATLLVLISSITLIPLAAKLLWSRYRRRQGTKRHAGKA
jgi:uncharacterized membrane protein YdjX (TVP38/TMEM64 family)